MGSHCGQGLIHDVHRRLFRAADISCMKTHDGSAGTCGDMPPSVLLRTKTAWRGRYESHPCEDEAARKGYRPGTDWVVIELERDFDPAALQLLRDEPALRELHQQLAVADYSEAREAVDLILQAERRALFLRERKVLALESAKAHLDRREQALDERQAALEAKEVERKAFNIYYQDAMIQISEAERRVWEFPVAARVQQATPQTEPHAAQHATTQTEASGVCPLLQAQVDKNIELQQEIQKLKEELGKARVEKPAAEVTGKKRAADKAEPTLEPLGRLGIPGLSRVLLRRYLSSMGASTNGDVDELKGRLTELFAANSIDQGEDDGAHDQAMVYITRASPE